MSNEIIVHDDSIDQELYAAIKNILLESRQKAYKAVSSAMLGAYWDIGCIIVEHEQNGDDKAKYGKKVLEILSERLTSEFGKGFDVRNLRNMRSFYLTFPNRNALRTDLTVDTLSGVAEGKIRGSTKLVH